VDTGVNTIVVLGDFNEDQLKPQNNKMSNIFVKYNMIQFITFTFKNGWPTWIRSMTFGSVDEIKSIHELEFSVNKGNNKITELRTILQKNIFDIYVTEYGTALTNILPILFLYLNTVTVTTGTFEP
jgi:hypothetical protein